MSNPNRWWIYFRDVPLSTRVFVCHNESTSGTQLWFVTQDHTGKTTVPSPSLPPKPITSFLQILTNCKPVHQPLTNVAGLGQFTLKCQANLILIRQFVSRILGGLKHDKKTKQNIWNTIKLNIASYNTRSRISEERFKDLENELTTMK